MYIKPLFRSSILLLSFLVLVLMFMASYNIQTNPSAYRDLAYATTPPVNSTTNTSRTNDSNDADQSLTQDSLGDSTITNNNSFPALSSFPLINSSIVNETPPVDIIPDNVTFSSSPFTTSSLVGPNPGALQIPYTGLTRYHITPAISKLFGLNETTYAMLVTGVEPGSPAARAGIRSGNMTTNVSGDIIKVGGDMILAVDDNTSFVRNNEAFLNYLQNEKIVGENITLNILRDGQIHDIELTIEALPRFLWYENEDEGIRMKYPSDWRVDQSDLSKQDIVEFLSPETVAINNRTLPIADVFVRTTQANIGLDEYASAQQKDTGTTRVLDIFLTSVSNLPGYERVYYDYSDKERTLKILSVFTIKDEQLYRINFAVDPLRYDDYSPLAGEMIKSFQFTK
jgi:hypothetical protein